MWYWTLWEVSKAFQTGDAKEGTEPRPPAVLCQEWDLAINLQVQTVFTWLINPTDFKKLQK